ncbi:MAG TPA: glucans biosynthesis glucosyltransferase MdoH, partial [Geminicoccaceae bacterium]
LSLIEIAILTLFALTFGWITIAFWTALVGYLVIVTRRRGPAAATPADAEGVDPVRERTALIMPVYHEDADEVGLRIRAMYRSLERAGALEGFDFFILSDSRRADVVRAEEALWARLCRELDASGRLFYRRRPRNEARKSGNIADFCERWGGAYDFFVVLDADSVMSASTLTTLVRLMAANPRAGLIQTVPQPIRAETLFARIQQFAARLYSPLFAYGVAWWYPARSSYWGHNAIIRTRAFMDSCGLPVLPGSPPLGGEIMSHDFVEAALLRRAGWEVWLEPGLGGSYEELPPTLGDYAQRDRRWAQGNLQHARLITWKGLSAVSRGHLAMGVMSYLASPMWFLLLILTTAEALLTDPSDWVYFPEANLMFPVWPVARAVELIGLFSVTMGMLLLPKLLALGHVLVHRNARRGFGGGVRLVASVLAEIVFATLLAPVLMVQQTAAVLGTLLGRTVGWSSQQRSAGAQAVMQGVRRYGPITLLGLVWSGIAWIWSPGLLVWLSPVVAGMILAVPIAVISGRRSVGLRARRHGWFLVPEETDPPPVVRDLLAPEASPRHLDGETRLDAGRRHAAIS